MMTKLGWMIYKLRNMILYDYEIPKLEYFDPNTGLKKVNSIYLLYKGINYIR